MTSFYLIGDGLYDVDNPEFESALAYAHERGLRPLCQCREAGVPMYVAKIGGHFHVKRMPVGGLDHAGCCASYERPFELDGFGMLKGNAIKDADEDGKTVLSLGFPFTRGGLRVQSEPSDSPAPTVKADKSRLTLLSTLHYLFDQAGLNRWAPGFSGKRGWGLVRRLLMLAVEGKHAKGAPLAEHLWIPEAWSADRKEELAARRSAWMARLMSVGPNRSRPLALLVGEVKAFEPSRYGMQMVVKQSPDFAWFMSEAFYEKLKARFGWIIQGWELKEARDPSRGHLMAIGLFSVAASGVAMLEEAALMWTTCEWLPVCSPLDAILVQHLVAQRRSFTKGLRYNTPQSRPIVTAVIEDTLPRPTGLFLLPPGCSDDYAAIVAQLARECTDRLDSWIWTVANGEMPALPAPASSSNLAAAGRRGPRPYFLEVSSGAEPVMRIVSLKQPHSSFSVDGQRVIVADVDEILEPVVGLTRADLDGIGTQSDLAPPAADWRYLRLTGAEAAKLSALAKRRRVVCELAAQGAEPTWEGATSSLAEQTV